MKIFLEISTFADLKLKDERVMLLTTTNTVEGKRVVHYYGVVSGETIIGANIFRDFFASIREILSADVLLHMSKCCVKQRQQH